MNECSTQEKKISWGNCIIYLFANVSSQYFWTQKYDVKTLNHKDALRRHFVVRSKLIDLYLLFENSQNMSQDLIRKCQDIFFIMFKINQFVTFTYNIQSSFICHFLFKMINHIIMRKRFVLVDSLQICVTCDHSSHSE